MPMDHSVQTETFPGTVPDRIGIGLTTLAIFGPLLIVATVADVSGEGVARAFGHFATGPFSACIWQGGELSHAFIAASVGAALVGGAALGSFPLYDLRLRQKLWLSAVSYLLYWEFWGLVWLTVDV